jgi:hypothetical protein
VAGTEDGDVVGFVKVGSQCDECLGRIDAVNGTNREELACSQEHI